MTELRDASDATLVVAIGRWRQEALAEAYRRHGASVYGLACHLLSDRVVAEDVVQDVFLRLWNMPDRFDAERGSLRSFLLANAHGRAIDIMRSETARRRREDREVQQVAEIGRSVDEEVVDVVMAETVREALMQLPEGERVPIELSYFGGHSYQETAALLEQPEGTIKSRIRSGLKRMRSVLPGVEAARS